MGTYVRVASGWCSWRSTRSIGSSSSSRSAAAGCPRARRRAHLFAPAAGARGPRPHAARAARRRDARLVWRGSFVALVEGARPAARGGRVRRLRPRDDRARDRVGADLRDRRRPRRAASSWRATFETLVAPGRPAAGADRAGSPGSPTRSCARAPRVATGAAAVLGVRRRRRARRPQRPLRRRLRQPRARAADRQAARGDRDRHGAARAQPARAAASQRTSLASLAFFFGVSREPCHRALPDAQATAEVFVAPDRARAGARRDDASPSWRSSRRRGRAASTGSAGSSTARPPRPGVYLFHDRHGQVLYVGKARDLPRAAALVLPEPARSGRRSRSRSTRSSGSSGACSAPSSPRRSRRCALIRELRPPANARKPAARALRLPPAARRGGRRQPRAVALRPAPPARARRARRAGARRLPPEEFDELLAGARPDSLETPRRRPRRQSPRPRGDAALPRDRLARAHRR